MGQSYTDHPNSWILSLSKFYEISELAYSDKTSKEVQKSVFHHLDVSNTTYSWVWNYYSHPDTRESFTDHTKSLISSRHQQFCLSIRPTHLQDLTLTHHLKNESCSVSLRKRWSIGFYCPLLSPTNHAALTCLSRVNKHSVIVM